MVQFAISKQTILKTYIRIGFTCIVEICVKLNWNSNTKATLNVLLSWTKNGICTSRKTFNTILQFSENYVPHLS